MMKKLVSILLLVFLTAASVNAQTRSVSVNPSTGQLVKTDTFGNFTNFFLMNIFWLTNALNSAGYTPGGVGGVVDGDKGDITVSGGVWSLDAGVVANAEIASGAAIDATKIAGGNVDNTEFNHLNGVNANIQDQIDGLAAGGVADGDKGDITVSGSGLNWTVDSGLPATRIADGSVSNTEFQHLNGVTGPVLDGSLTANRIPFASDANTLTDAAGLRYESETLSVRNLSVTNYSATKTHGLDGIMVNNWLDPSQITTNVYGPFKYQAAFIGSTDGGILLAGADPDGSHVTEITLLSLDADGNPLHRWHHNIKTTSGGKTFALATGTNTTVALNEAAANAGESGHSYYLFGANGNLAFNGIQPYLSFIDRDRNANSNRTDMRFDSGGGFYLQFANQGYSVAHNAIAVVRGESTNAASIALNADAVSVPGTLAVGGTITGGGSGLTDLNGNQINNPEATVTVGNAGTFTLDGSTNFYSINATGASFNIDLGTVPAGEQATVWLLVTNSSGGSQVATILEDAPLQWRESGTYALTITNAQDTLNEYSFTGSEGVWKLFSAPYVPVATGTSTVTNFTDLADVPSSYSGEGGKGVRVNVGETGLEFYTLAGSSALASGEVLTTDNAATPVLTNAVAAGNTKYYEAYVSGTGPTNGWSGNAFLRLANRDGTGVGVSNAVPSLVEGSGGATAYWAAVGTNAVLYVQGADQENVSWSWEAWVRREHTNGLAAASATTYLLDKITNIFTAFAGSAARKLTNSATAPFRIHRMSDATEQDATFTGDVTDTTSVSSFVSSGSARVSKFYNQTGETAQDLLTTTTNMQPVIMIDGTLQTLGGFPALHLNIDNTTAYDDQITTAANYNQDQPWTVYAVVSVEEVTGTDRYFASFGSTARGAMGADATSTGRVLMNSGSTLAGPTITTTTMYLFRAVVNGGSSEIGLDGDVPTTGAAGANTMTRISIGQSTTSLRSKVVEFIVVLGVPSTDQNTLIVNDMKDFYGIL